MVDRSNKGLLRGIISKMTKLYEQMVTNSAQFEVLRETTTQTISEFKRLLEKHEDRVRFIEQERVMKEAELLGRINSLQERLNVLSEDALYQAMKGAAEPRAKSVDRPPVKELDSDAAGGCPESSLNDSTEEKE